MIIIDTNVLSELMRPRPDQQVEQWLASQPSASLFTTTNTRAEILFGIALLPTGKRRNGFEQAASEMFEQDFEGRLLSFDCSASTAYVSIAARRRRAGHPISQFDAQIAAIAYSRGSLLATRNSSDFEDCGIELIDPWQG